MPEFKLPTTAAEWAAVEPNETDREVAEAAFSDLTRPDGCAADAERVAAASRLLERERCVAALAKELSLATGLSAPEDEARRILEDAK